MKLVRNILEGREGGGDIFLDLRLSRGKFILVSIFDTKDI